jgi:hypothetical protein
MAHRQMRLRTADRKHACYIIATDDDFLLASAPDRQILRDVQLVGETDRALESAGKVDLVGARRCIGGLNGLAQRSGAAVEKVIYRERGEHPPAFKRLKTARCPATAGAADWLHVLLIARVTS